MRRFAFSLIAVSLIAAAATPAVAQRWGYPGGGPYGWGGGWAGPAPRGPDSREGKVEVTRYVAEGTAATQLGHGPVTVVASPNDTSDERERATYEAAVIDRLAGVGYDTATHPGEGGQTVELRILHAEVEPPEAPHKPVSGAMSVGVSNRGSYEALAIGVDLSKPRKALVSTRLEARIRDKATGAVLWEGHADIDTREGDKHWTDQAIASRLAGALFSGFPGKNGESIRA
jgi:hypothetical protein